MNKVLCDIFMHRGIFRQSTHNKWETFTTSARSIGFRSHHCTTFHVTDS